MARNIVYACDVCGVDRKATNHWFIVEGNARGLKFDPMIVGGLDHPSMETMPVMVCGPGCGVKLLSKWMETGSLLAGIAVAKTEVVVAKTEVSA